MQYNDNFLIHIIEYIGRKLNVGHVKTPMHVLSKWGSRFSLLLIDYLLYLVYLTAHMLLIEQIYFSSCQNAIENVNNASIILFLITFKSINVPYNIVFPSQVTNKIINSKSS